MMMGIIYLFIQATCQFFTVYHLLLYFMNISLILAVILISIESFRTVVRIEDKGGELLFYSFGVISGADEFAARYSLGMRSWYILQRMRGYKPYKTRVSKSHSGTNISF